MKLRLLLLILALLTGGFSYSQNESEGESEDVIVEDTVIYRDTYTSPVIKDDMTVDPEQNKKWRKGLYKFPAKPKDAWELGIHGGHFFLDGDVDELHPLSGFGLGIHLRKAIHYTFSVRFDLFYGQTYGIDPQPWNDALTPERNFDGIFTKYVENEMNWYPSYKMEYIEASMQAVFNIGNILFHKERNKWNWIAFVGVGLNSNQTMLDLYDKNGNIYNTKPIDAITGGDEHRSQRYEREKKIKEIYDGKYETKAYRKKYIFRLSDKYHVHASFIAGMGVYRKINKRINIGLEHQTMINDNDYLDGMKYRTAQDQSNQPDMLHYTSIKLAINIANFKKRTEPLYWLNPLDAIYRDVAQLKQRPVFDLTDSDGDGVIDMLDMEMDTPSDCPVDTRGVLLDSDGDGLPDCHDKEPYSPPGYEVDENGVALIPKEEKCCVTKDDVRKMLNESMARGGVVPVTTPSGKTVYTEGISDWFLPMIHFDLDKYYIKPEYYGHLKHVAEMMKKYPHLCVTAFGATDVRNSNAYNDMLSYNRAKAAIDYLVENYGIDRSRFKLMYGGENKPLVPNLPDSHNVSKEVEMGHYMNRRVEFRACRDTDYDMPRPAGVIDAGRNTPGPSRPGSKYKGNKTIGF